MDEQRIVIETSDLPTTHRNVVVGVTILAALALFSTFFAISIIAMATIAPPESSFTISEGLELVTVGDYFTPIRLLVATAASVVAVWIIFDRLAGER